MTRLFVDQREVPFPPLGIASLDQIVRHIEDSHLPTDSVIRQIDVDGTPITGEEFSGDTSPLLEPLVRKTRIDIYTGKIWEIAQDSICEAVAYLDRIQAIIPSLAMNMQIAPGPEAFQDLKQLYDGFYWLSILVGRLESTFEINPALVSVGGEAASEQLAKFGAIVKQLVEAQEGGDYILVADLLEYEVLPLVPVWKEMFTLFKEKLARRP
jgi:hypothetical protein